jgi:hypothetical protein
MTQQLEDRLRAAFLEKAAHIPPTAPQLGLAARPRRARRPAVTGGPGRWLKPGQRKLAAGLAAAAAVTAVAVGTVVASSPPAPPAPPPTAGPAANPPPYYVATANAANHVVAVVRATRTGAVIATVPVPHPYTAFGGVTGAADDRTFVLMAVSYAGPALQEKFYLLRIDPGARLPADRTRLTPLSLRLPPAVGVIGMALSPDGGSLAVAGGAETNARPGNRIIVYNLSTGASHSWADQGCRDHCTIADNLGASFETNMISWTADGRQLGFVADSGAPLPRSQFRLLNVGAAGDNVLTDSQPVPLRAASGALQGVNPRDAAWGIALITPDGGSVILDSANILRSGQPVPPQNLLRYSARTGGLQTVLGVRPNRPQAYAEQVLWTSPDGSTVLVTGFRGQHSAGLLHDGRYTPIPWSAQLLSAAW